MLAEILSTVAIVLSAASLGWQVRTWNRSGAVVSVAVGQAMPTYGDRVGDPHVQVTAINKGRSPVSVTSWGLKLPDGRHLAILEPASWSARLPYRLEAGDSASWYAPTKAVTESCGHNDVSYQDLIAYVDLGNGHTVEAEKRGIGWK